MNVGPCAASGRGARRTPARRGRRGRARSGRRRTARTAAGGGRPRRQASRSSPDPLGLRGRPAASSRGPPTVPSRDGREGRRGDASVPGPDGPREVRLSNPDKIYFPERGITKREVVTYYAAVAGAAAARAVRAPHEPQALRRRGQGEAFYVKRMPKGAPPYARPPPSPSRAAAPRESCARPSRPCSSGRRNLGTFDFHPWPVRRADPDRPDELRIDLDPQPGTDFADAVVVAACCARCSTRPGWSGGPRRPAGAASTSRCGSAGVVVRRRPPGGDRDRPQVARRIPERATVVVEGGARRRVFLDYNQAARDRTIASAWSVRGRAAGDRVDAGDLGDPARRRARGLRRADGAGPVRRARRPARRPGRRACATSRRAGVVRPDERAGLGDLPYPPEYPKMPGEPIRVQPSRARQ